MDIQEYIDSLHEANGNCLCPSSANWLADEQVPVTPETCVSCINRRIEIQQMEALL